jgi:Cu(I)/Ag(I) efflux system membrane fusion protein
MSEMNETTTPDHRTDDKQITPAEEANRTNEHSEHPDEPMPEGEEAPPPGVRTMAIIRWAIVIIMAAAALFALNHYYGWVDLGGTSSGESGTIYYCPMHPEVQQDHPGECPICSMTLVPKPDGPRPQGAGMGTMTESAGHDHTGEGSGVPTPEAKMVPAKGAEGVPGLTPVTLSQERIQLMGMRTAKVTRETLTPELRTVGVAAANEKGLAVIQTRFAGWIEQLLLQQTGQRVTKGQVLATIYSPELLTAQQEYLNALRWAGGSDVGTSEPTHAAKLSADLAQDARRRLELLGISPPEIAEIERTGQPMRALRIRSPVTGHVIEKNAIQGIYVQPGTTLFQVADLSTIWVLADVYEYEIGRIQVGQRAKIEFASYPGQSFTGNVTFIYPTLNPNTRTMRVRLELRNPQLKLKPAMYGDIYIELERAEGLIVPRDALVDTGETQYVFIAQPQGRFEPRKVKAGARVDGKVQILEGVAEGETVVTTANFLLDSESRLQAAISGEETTGADTGAPVRPMDICETEIDKQKYPDKYQQCVACRAHRGMGTMEEDCRNAIPKPWK